MGELPVLCLIAGLALEGLDLCLAVNVGDGIVHAQTRAPKLVSNRSHQSLLSECVPVRAVERLERPVVVGARAPVVPRRALPHANQRAVAVVAKVQVETLVGGPPVQKHVCGEPPLLLGLAIARGYKGRCILTPGVRNGSRRYQHRLLPQRILVDCDGKFIGENASGGVGHGAHIVAGDEGRGQYGPHREVSTVLVSSHAVTDFHPVEVAEQMMRSA